MLALKVLDDLGRAVGRIVIHHQHMEIRRQTKYMRDNVLDILLLVIGRNDDETLGHWVGAGEAQR